MIESPKTTEINPTASANGSVKDAGKVRVGAGMMRFDVKDSGKVRVGAGMMRFDTRDTGKVRVGAGMMRF